MMNLLVKQLRWEADDVVSLTLVDPFGQELPEWEPGAHLELHLPSGPIRHYSLYSEPGDRRHYSVAVLKEPESRGGSRIIHEELRVGTTLSVKEPRNNFRFTPTSRIEFIVGGIGITPILPMVRRARELGLDWRLWYGGRSRATMAFLEELDEFEPERILLYPEDENGLIDLDTALSAPSGDASIYCCGPSRLLAAVETRCEGWPEKALHVERFAAPKPTTTAAAASAADCDASDNDEAGDFEISASASGVTVRVAANGSVLDALESAGVSVPSSCREGICGSCEVKVLQGRADHRDLILSDDEKAATESMMICVSRARSNLVLDI